MKVREIDLQNIALIKLTGQLDMKTIETVIERAQNLLDNNRFKVVIDLQKVTMNDLVMLSLADFLNDFKKSHGNIKLLPSIKGGFIKIELRKLSLNIPMSVKSRYCH